MLAIVTMISQISGERTLEAGYRLKISRLQHNVIGLIGCIIYCGENVFTVQKFVVCQNFLKRSPSAYEFQNIGYPDTLPSDTGAPTTFALFHRDPA
jgi:hypothetical protein